MNLRKRPLVTTIRVVFGLLMLFSGVAGLMIGNKPMEGTPQIMVDATNMLWATGLFQMIKVTEVVAGLMLVLNFLPALAAIFIAPIAVGVIVFNAMIAPSYVVSGVILGVLDAYLGYAYWDKYKALFTR